MMVMLMKVILNNDLYTDFSSFGENVEFIIWYKVKKGKHTL